jgi:RHS repeat-associated protein
MKYGASSSLKQKFTGHERDSESGLDFAQARYCSSVTGRFMSVDPLMNMPSNCLTPQAWNRYSYVLNNPQLYSDPTGMSSESPNQDSAKPSEIPIVQFEILGMITLLGKNVTVYVNAGASEGFRKLALSRFKEAAKAINDSAKNFTSEEARILGNINAIAITDSNYTRNPTPGAISDFRARGITEMGNSTAIINPDGVVQSKGVFFVEFTRVGAFWLGAEALASTLFHEAFHIEDQKTGHYDSAQFSMLGPDSGLLNAPNSDPDYTVTADRLGVYNEKRASTFQLGAYLKMVKNPNGNYESQAIKSMLEDMKNGHRR